MLYIDNYLWLFHDNCGYFICVNHTIILGSVTVVLAYLCQHPLSLSLSMFQVQQAAVDRGLFPSFWQRSVYNVPSLQTRPFWSVEDLPEARSLIKYVS